MLNNRKIGQKIAIGLGVMVAIFTVVIGMTIINLGRVSSSSKEISKVDLPMLEMAQEANLITSAMMLEMRGFIYTEDPKRLEAAEAKITELGAKLDELKKFSETHSLDAASKKEIQTALETYATYVETKEAYKKAYLESVEVKAGLTKAITAFYDNTKGYEEDQNASFKAELAADTDHGAFSKRVTKLVGINKVIADANLARMYVYRALQARDATGFDPAIGLFPGMESRLESMLSLTTKAANKDQLETLMSATTNYQENVKKLKAIMATEVSLQGDLLSHGNALMDSSAGVVKQAISVSVAEGNSNASAVNFTNVFLVIGFILALGLGISVNYSVIKSVTSGIRRVTTAAQEIAIGNTNFELKSDTKDEIGELTDAFNTMKMNISDQANVVKNLAEGNTDIMVNVLSEQDTLNISLKVAIENINAITHDLSQMIESVKNGDLTARGNATKFTGAWRGMMSGVNELVEAFVDPLDVTNQYVTMLGRGEIPPEITKTYYGDFNNIKVNLNQCINAINRLVEDTNQLILAADEGRLSTRAEESHHQGEYREIVKGINKTLDAVIEPVNEAAAVLEEFSRGNLKAHVKGQYKGDHAAIKTALNNTISSISGYIMETSDILNQMADGNLEVQITSDFKGDFVSMKNAINNIIDSLNEVLGEINMASDQVATGSRQVAQSSQALSHGSTVQASSIEEITASMTEISEQTKENAINASKANEFSNTAKEAASKGNQQMSEMVTAMRDINDSSSNISKIIAVIDEIAFQTNILALNAAVEAARAGQHGKGFAVVAEEVRNLAARSANAAKETTVMIENSVVKVGRGMDIAEDTAKALVDIVEGTSKAADLVADIAYASNEQATAISQINEGIFQVSQVTQNNTATAEESAAASEEMTSQAQMLKEMVSKFRLRHGKRSYGSMSAPTNYNSYQPSYGTSHNNNNDHFTISLDDDEFGKY